MDDGISINVIEKVSPINFFEEWRRQVNPPLPKGIDIRILEQIKFCKSKKKRILKKWSKNPKNFKEVSILNNCHIESVTMSVVAEELACDYTISYEDI